MVLPDTRMDRWLLGSVVVGMLALGGWLLPLTPLAWALQFAPTPRQFGALVHLWSADELLRYRWSQPLGMVLAVGYAWVGWRWVRQHAPLLPGPAWGHALWAGLLPLAALADGVENVLHWWLTGTPRFGVPEVYAAALLATAAKWCLWWLFGGLVLWVAYRRAGSA